MAEIEVRSGRGFPEAQRLIVDAVKAADDGERFTVTLWGRDRKHRNALLRWLADTPGVTGVSLPDAGGVAFSVAFDRPTVHEWRTVADPTRRRWGVVCASWVDDSTPTDSVYADWVYVPHAAAEPSPVTSQRPMAWVF